MAPGVGKTFAMLGEARRAADRGTDVVVGCVETYGRVKTQELLEGLERLPPRRVEYREAIFDELDAEAMIARRPTASWWTSSPTPTFREVGVRSGGRTCSHPCRRHRSRVHAQHPAPRESDDVIATVTGVRQRETVPDWLLDLADQSSSSTCPQGPAAPDDCTATSTPIRRRRARPATVLHHREPHRPARARLDASGGSGGRAAPGSMVT